ncbi:MAG: hypothetical protein ACP5JV_06940 [Thermus sp.]|uniref:hypothetical protein n=1 Tax=Thermus sp. TaxID=275 RepID=UPI003D0AF9CF
MRALMAGLLALSALLAACGNQGQGGGGGAPPPIGGLPAPPPGGGGGGTPPPSSGGGGLSGTVSLGQTIQGGTVRGSWVIALYYDPSQDAFDQNRSKGVQIGQDGRQAPFNLSGLVAGQYVLVGFKDMDGNGEVTPPDYLGIYQDSQGNFLVTPGRSGLSLVMELAGAYGNYGYAQQGTLVGLPAGAFRTLRVPTGR